MKKSPLMLVICVAFLFSCAPSITSRPHPQKKESPPGLVYEKKDVKETVDEKEVVKKLEQLKEMKEKGLITEQEYQSERKEILRKL